MSATEDLRRMLDERGVEYEGGERSVRWRDRNGVMMQAFPLANGELGMDVWSCTPEQAIAATLGSEDTYTREDVEGAFVSGYSLGLDMFDSSKPDDEKGWNQNERNMDEEMEELGWVRVDAATLGAGTCRISVQDNLAETDGIGDVWLECDECHWQMPLEPSTPRFNFCPNCGRRVVDE